MKLLFEMHFLSFMVFILIIVYGVTRVWRRGTMTPSWSLCLTAGEDDELTSSFYNVKVCLIISRLIMVRSMSTVISAFPVL